MISQSPTRVRYRVIAVSMLMAFILYLDRICLSEIVKSDSFRGEIHLTKDQIGTILGSFFLTYALCQVPAGWASDRFGARTMLTLYIVFWSVFTGLTGLMSSFGGLLLMRLLCGAAEAGAYPACGAVIRRWVPVQGRGLASACVIVGGRTGGTLAPWLTTLLVVQFGHWRPALWIDGLVGLVIAALYWMTVRNRPQEHPAVNEAERAFIGEPPAEKPVTAPELGGMLAGFLRSRTLWLASLYLLLVNLGWAFLITWLPSFLKDHHHVDDVLGSKMVSVVLGCGMIGQLAGGLGADLSLRFLGRRWGRVLPLALSGLIAGLGYLGCLSTTTAWEAVICLCIVSFSVDLGNPGLWAILQDVGGRSTGSALGWTNMWGNLGAFATAKLVPKLQLMTDNPEAGQRMIFYCCAGVLFLSGLLSLGLDATRPLSINTKEREAVG
ncbi:MFS transporter [Planctomicrobium sp. SH664]|uniref:MFS transporter n=1 Tax=Planctomicrobium sp. SH664 TaxID=3448125 RepID=UPI003F5C4FDD